MTRLFIISIETFDSLLSELNITLNESYYASYVITNLFVYISIAIIIYTIITLINFLFKKPKFL